MASTELPHFSPHRIEPLPLQGLKYQTMRDNHTCCCSLRCLLISSFIIIALMVVALIVVPIEVSITEDENDFDEYFRTPEEQAEYEKTVFASEAQLYTTGFSQSTDRCSFRCSGQVDRDESGRPSQTTTRKQIDVVTRQPPVINRPETAFPAVETGLHSNMSASRRKRQAIDISTYPPVRHACCISRMLFIRPEEAMTVRSQRIIVIQEGSRGQYFKSYNCSHVEGCTGCGCCQSVEHHRAVVRRPNKDRRFVALIILPGCCKCYNNLDPNNC